MKLYLSAGGNSNLIEKTFCEGLHGSCRKGFENCTHLSMLFNFFQIFSLEIIRYPIIQLIFLCNLSYCNLPPLYGFCVLETLIVDGFIQPDLY